MDKVARPDHQRTSYVFPDSWNRWPGMTFAYPRIEIFTLIFIWQAFSPATVIFAGIGVLLSVCILYNLA